jgi:hypothetical protein
MLQPTTIRIRAAPERLSTPDKLKSGVVDPGGVTAAAPGATRPWIVRLDALSGLVSTLPLFCALDPFEKAKPPWCGYKQLTL